MLSGAGKDEIFPLRSSAMLAIVWTLVALKVALLLILAWNRRFVMDEFVQLGWAKYIPDQALWIATHHPKALGYAVFFDLAHLVGWDARSMLLLGRLETALLACGTLAIVYGCARALGEPRLRAALIVLILLSFSNFMERIIETRAEPLAVFFAIASLLVVLRGQADKAWTIVSAGALSGLAFLATQKSVYFNLALGLALVGDAALARRYAKGISRGALLVLGWSIPIVAYCFIFGGADPLPVAKNLAFGPAEVASAQIAGEYGGLRQYLMQTLLRNALLYSFYFAGMMLEMLRIRAFDERRRIALIFTIVIASLVFAHNQPWPYVFIMALPFMALWALVPLDRVAENAQYLRIGWVVLGIAIIVSFARNVAYLRLDNDRQLELVARAESLLGRDEIYFDGVGMLPNRAEPSTLWLDRHYVLKTLREGRDSEAYRIFANTPPKLILWSYRMDDIASVVAPLIDNSYARVAPNIRMAGRRLEFGRPTMFNVPVAGRYRLYSETGQPVQGSIDVDGAMLVPPIALNKGPKSLTLRSGARVALFLPEGAYGGLLKPGPDDPALFAGVYN